MTAWLCCSPHSPAVLNTSRFCPYRDLRSRVHTRPKCLLANLMWLDLTVQALNLLPPPPARHLQPSLVHHSPMSKPQPPSMAHPQAPFILRRLPGLSEWSWALPSHQPGFQACRRHNRTALVPSPRACHGRNSQSARGGFIQNVKQKTGP